MELNIATILTPMCHLHSKLSLLVTFSSFAALVGTTSAANLTANITQGSGNHWGNAIWQPGAVSPTAGNTYQCVVVSN